MNIDKFKQYRNKGLNALLAYRWAKNEQVCLDLDFEDSGNSTYSDLEYAGLRFRVEVSLDYDMRPSEWEDEPTMGELLGYYRKVGYSRNRAFTMAQKDMQRHKDYIEGFGSRWHYFDFCVELLDPLSNEVLTYECLGGVGLESLQDDYAHTVIAELAEQAIHSLLN